MDLFVSCFLWRNVYSNSLHFFKTESLSLSLSCESPTYILDISPLLEICFANIFSQHEGCLDPVLQSTNVF